jgi:hypothetical protein
MEQPAEFEKLANIALKSASFVKRKEALLELGKYDSPRAVEVLEEASANDVNRDVRELAKSLLAARKGSTVIQPDAPTTTPSPALLPAEPAWQCAFCGMENTGGDKCYYCDAARPSVEEELSEFPETVQREAFLLNPGNRAFVTGQSRRLAPASYGCVLLFFIPFLAAGLFFLAFGLNSLYQWQQLTTEGVTTRAKFIDRRISSDSDNDTTYHVTFQFGLDNRTYVVEQNVDSDIYSRAETGVVVDVVYVPHNPTLAKIAGTEASPAEAFVLVFSLCWNGFVWLVVLSTISSRRKHRALERGGQLTRGEVVACSGRSGSKGAYILTVEYRFSAPDSGEMLSHKQTATRNDLRGQLLPAPGTPLAILYLDRETYQAL